MDLFGMWACEMLWATFSFPSVYFPLSRLSHESLYATFYRLPRWKNTTKHVVIVLIDTNLPRRLVIYMYVYTLMYIYMNKLGVCVCETCNSEECIEELWWYLWYMRRECLREPRKNRPHHVRAITRREDDYERVLDT